MSSLSSPPQQRTQLVLNLLRQQDVRDTLPDLGVVRQSVARVPAIRETMAQMPEHSRILLQNPRTGEIERDPAPRSLWYNSRLPDLFKYSFLIHISDVPLDILETVIWALEMFIDVFTECTDNQLLAFGHIFKAEDSALDVHGRVIPQTSALVSDGRLILRLQAKAKATLFLLKPEINRPGDAAKYLQEVVEHICSRHGPTAGDIFKAQHDLFMIYAESLTRSGEDDAIAETLLERLADSDTRTQDTSGLDELITAKVYFSRVLRRRGKGGRAKEQEKWLVKWFRKNPHMLSDETLWELLIPTGETTSPILEALGGPSWLTGREHTDKTDHRLIKKCRYCFAREPMVKLFVCSKCKKIYYCSKECQKKEWPLHKDSCRDFVTVNQRIEKLSLMDTSAAQREKDWVAWRDSVDHWPYISALRLHEDPGRARTHLVVEQSVYTPNAGSLAKNKFQIVKCAVFRMLDAYTEIERIMGLDRGEGVEYCDGLLQEPERTQTGLTFIPFLTLRYHEGFASAWLNCDEIDTRKLESGTYNRNWRKNINGNRPPTQLVLRDDIEDAEFD